MINLPQGLRQSTSYCPIEHFRIENDWTIDGACLVHNAQPVRWWPSSGIVRVFIDSEWHKLKKRTRNATKAIEQAFEFLMVHELFGYAGERTCSKDAA